MSRKLLRADSEVGEQLKFLLARLQLQGDGLPSSLAVTSALSGEGVTLICDALATVVSEQLGQSVCLIDVNWWSQQQPNPGDGPGLASVLRGERTLEEVIIHIEPNLAKIRAGEMLREDRSLLATETNLAEIITVLKERYDHIVLDLPATSVTAASLALATAADATMLVAMQRSIRIDQVQRALADLSHTDVLGIVLNNHKLHIPRRLQRRLLNA